MSANVTETNLALYAAGDLPVWQRIAAAWHVRGCEKCRGLLDAFRGDRERLRKSADMLPENVDWDALSAEMTANIRVGLAAGECVTPRASETVGLAWLRPAAAVAGIVMLLAGAWWLNIPRADTETIGRAIRSIATGERKVPLEERGPMVGASSSGVEFSEN